MHDIINFLKGAVDREATTSVNGCYMFKGGYIHARNNFLHAIFAAEGKVEFNVPASELDAALARMPEIQSLKIKGDVLTIKCGRLSSNIKLIMNEAHDLPDMPEEWNFMPDGFTSSLTKAVLFLGEIGWTQGISISDERVMAVRNNRGIDIKVENLHLDSPVLITKEVAKFLIAQGDPSEYAEVPYSNNREGVSAIMFRWEDGRVVKAQLLDMQAQNVDRVFDEAGTETPLLITSEWREAYEDAVGLSDGKITITPKGFKTVKGVANNTVDFPMPELPEGHESHWETDNLNPMLEVGTAWNPNAYPDKALFTGDGVRGLVMGFRK